MWEDYTDKNFWSEKSSSTIWCFERSSFSCLYRTQMTRNITIDYPSHVLTRERDGVWIIKKKKKSKCCIIENNKFWRPPRSQQLTTSCHLCSKNDTAQLSTETNQRESARIDEHSRSRRPWIVRELPDLSMWSDRNWMNFNDVVFVWYIVFYSTFLNRILIEKRIFFLNL